MKLSALTTAIAEAERFLERAKRLRDTARADSDWPPQIDFTGHHPKESGATRRASMDLTRALADLRRPS